MKKERVGELVLVLVTLCWGLTFVLIKDAVESITPLMFVGIRFSIAAGLMALYFLWRRDLLQKLADRGTLIAGSLLGVFLFAGYSFQTFGLKYTSVSNAGFITGLAVVLVPLISVIFVKSTIRLNSWIGIALATAGLALLTLNEELRVRFGDTLVFFCSIAFACQIILVGKYVNQMNPFVLAWIQTLCCGVLSLAASVVFEPESLSTVGQALRITEVQVGLVFCGVVATALAYWAQNHFQQFTSPVKVALIFAAEPVFSAIFGYLLAGDQLSPRQGAGAAILLLGILTSETGDKIFARLGLAT